jgi:hypothetical protein
VLLIDELDKVDDGFEAQAFKRACTCFGLGRYLYNFAEMWVPLNEYRQPLHYPALPKWALPRATAVPRGPIDQQTTAKIESFRRIVGDSIYAEILRRVAHADRADGIPNAQLQQEVGVAMERAARGIHKANSLAEQIGEAPFIAVLDYLQIDSMTTIPRLETLKQLVAELEQAAARRAA